VPHQFPNAWITTARTKISTVNKSVPL
jgi:hypothetical protein